MLDERIVTEKLKIDLEKKAEYFRNNMNKIKGDKSKVVKKLEWLIQQGGYESNTMSDPSIWRLNLDGIKSKIPDKISEEEITHLIYPILGFLREGGKYDYEIAHELDRPMFMIQHGLRTLSGASEGCPYSAIDVGCLEYQNPLVESVKPILAKRKYDDIQMTALRCGGTFEEIDKKTYQINGFRKVIDIVDGPHPRIYYGGIEEGKTENKKDIIQYMERRWKEKIEFID